MKKLRRKIFFLFIALCFVILTPCIILYSMGFRFDFENMSIKKVGMIIVESKPKDVQIYLNNKKMSNHSPAKLKNLFPKKYLLRVEKEGYQAWEKNLYVQSQTVTWASNIILFLENPTLEKFVDQPAEHFAFSEDKKKIAFTSTTSEQNYGLWLIENKSLPQKWLSKTEGVVKEVVKLFPKSEKERTKISLKKTSFDLMAWSPDSSKILTYFIDKVNKKNFIIIDVENENKNIIYLDPLLPQKIRKILWAEDSNKIFFLSEKQLYQFDLKTKSLTKLDIKNIFDFDYIKTKLYFTTSDCAQFQASEIVNKSFSNKEKQTAGPGNLAEESKDITRENEICLVRGEAEKIVNSPGEGKIIALLPLNNEIDTKNLSIKATATEEFAILMPDDALYLIDKQKEVKKLAEAVKNFAWAEAEKKLLYYNDYEIWFYAIKENFNQEENKHIHPQYDFNKSNHLLRLSTKIDWAAWHPDYEHIVFSTDGQIRITELDGRYRRNTHTLLTDTASSLENFAIDENGKMAFFVKKENKENFLYKASFIK